MIQYIKQYLDYAHHAFRLHLAIRMADIKQKAYNRRYFVMPIESSNGKQRLVSVSRKEAVKLRRMKWLPKNFNTLEMEQDALYYTDVNLNNKGTAKSRKDAMKKYMRYIGKRQ